MVWPHRDSRLWPLSIVVDNVIYIDAEQTSPTPATAASAPGPDPSSGPCWLTVDDGPNGATTLALLDVLSRHEVPAVFCVVGEAVATRDGAAVLREVVARGHVVGNHGWDFSDLGGRPPHEVRDSLRRTMDTVAEVVGGHVPVPWFRAANGSWGATVSVATGLGMTPLPVRGTIDDWLTQDTGILTANLRRVTEAGGLVLVHDGGGDRTGTVRALDRVLGERRDEGRLFTLPQPGQVGDP